MTLGRSHQVDLTPRPHDWARIHEDSAANASLLTSHRRSSRHILIVTYRTCWAELVS
jgi:hypothetical protein